MITATTNSIFSSIDASASPARQGDRNQRFLKVVCTIIAELSEGFHSARTYEGLVANGIGKADAARMALNGMTDERR